MTQFKVVDVKQQKNHISQNSNMFEEFNIGDIAILFYIKLNKMELVYEKFPIQQIGRHFIWINNSIYSTYTGLAHNTEIVLNQAIPFNHLFDKLQKEVNERRLDKLLGINNESI